MTGNGGGDTFVWRSTNETGVAANEADIVGADFNPLIGDTHVTIELIRRSR